ncbi:DUF1700 domain-containing protein [Culicoidibacter larvae]|uniref:DUF1700 domain-containing protein n=1 Tax=Culicoidibacter larvae TaxID=2579976 RepID=A0A5R8QDP7_9FIRM|nr:DUF1700 domain-containing protein [Culicoidibacter larvae]TLG75377.1 hypothetical protein FEZ08_04830 [Culicoidibacter larvae]
MTKEQYLGELQRHLSYYVYVDPSIIQGYKMNIDEMLDEGLTMNEVVERLGTPSQLANALAQEFDLVLRKKVGMPMWVKVILIICALPIILPFAFTAFMLVVTFFLILITFAITGITSAIWCWFSVDYTIAFKILYSIMGVSATVAFSILTYFAGLGVFRLTKKIFNRKRVV